MLQNINEIMAILKSYDVDVVTINSKESNIYIKTKNESVYKYDISSIISKIKIMLEANKQGIYCILI